MSDSPEPHPHEADRLIYAGLLWLTTVCVLPMIEKPRLDIAQEIGLHAFGLAFPLLAAGLITDYARKAGKRVPIWHDLICLCGALSCIVGLGSLLFHVNIIVGCIFVAGCLLGLLIVRRL